MSLRGIRRGNAKFRHKGGPSRLIKRVMEGEMAPKVSFPLLTALFSGPLQAGGRGSFNRKTRERMWDIKKAAWDFRTLYPLGEWSESYKKYAGVHLFKLIVQMTKNLNSILNQSGYRGTQKLNALAPSVIDHLLV